MRRRCGVAIGQRAVKHMEVRRIAPKIGPDSRRGIARCGGCAGKGARRASLLAVELSDMCII